LLLGERYAREVKGVRIGVTSPLLRQEEPVPEGGAVQHCRGVERAGAASVLLRIDMDPRCIIADAALDGIIFSGGGDVAAGSYGGDESLARCDVDFRRDAFEFALMERALALGLPILATCRGMHVANVMLDGTLIEDLRHNLGSAYRVAHDQVDDAGLPYDAHAHEVNVEPGTLLYDAAGAARFPVNSIHHQAIAELGNGLRVVARADDGVIEAIEFVESSSYFVGVQWHPEWLPADRVSQRLYARLLKEAERFKLRGFQDVRP
jgi:putative glutamine amidotransferase